MLLLGLLGQGAHHLRLLHARLHKLGGEALIGAFPIHDFIIFSAHGVGIHKGAAQGIGNGPDLGLGRQNGGPLGDGGGAVLLKEGKQGLAGGQLGEGLLGIEGGVGAEGLGHGADHLLLLGGEGAQRVLHPAGKLGKHGGGHVRRGLSDEIHAHALGTNQADHLLDALQQRLGAIVEEQMRLVKEEHHPGQGAIPLLGQNFIQLAQQPQQEGGIHGGLMEQLFGGEDMNHAVAVFILAEPIPQIQGGLAEEEIAPLILQNGDGPLHGPHGGFGDVAVIQGVAGGVFAHIGQHGLHILQIQQQHALVVRDAENDVHHAGLGFVQAQHAGKQQRAHFAHRGADGMTLFAVHIPEGDGAGTEGKMAYAAGLQAAFDFLVVFAGLAQARQIALNIRHKNGHAQLGKALGQHLQRDRFARARGPGDEAVAVGQGGQHAYRPL